MLVIPEEYLEEVLVKVFDCCEKFLGVNLCMVDLFKGWGFVRFRY